MFGQDGNVKVGAPLKRRKGLGIKVFERSHSAEKTQRQTYIAVSF